MPTQTMRRKKRTRQSHLSQTRILSMQIPLKKRRRMKKRNSRKKRKSLTLEKRNPIRSTWINSSQRDKRSWVWQRHLQMLTPRVWQLRRRHSSLSRQLRYIFKINSSEMTRKPRLQFFLLLKKITRSTDKTSPTLSIREQLLTTLKSSSGNSVQMWENTPITRTSRKLPIFSHLSPQPNSRRRKLRRLNLVKVQRRRLCWKVEPVKRSTLLQLKTPWQAISWEITTMKNTAKRASKGSKRLNTISCESMRHSKKINANL